MVEIHADRLAIRSRQKIKAHTKDCSLNRNTAILTEEESKRNPGSRMSGGRRPPPTTARGRRGE
jgi:hypothetical protein